MVPHGRELNRHDLAAWAVMIALAVAVTTCAASCAPATYRPGRGWTRVDTAAQVAVAATLAADGYQTMSYIGPNCMERNPIIGECGDRVPIPIYMPAVFALELAAAYALPPSWRRWFVGAFGGFEAAIVYTNWDTIRLHRAAARERAK